MSRLSAPSLQVPAGALAPALPPRRRAALALVAILGTGVVVGIVFGLWPRLDLAVTALGWDPAQRMFTHTWTPSLQAIRDVNDTIVRAVAISAGVILILWLAVPRVAAARLPQALSLRASLFVLATLAVAPGLIINGILKPFGGRPRPIEVTQFGGTLDFVPWWSPFGRCDSNCSFASGEMSSAMWLLAVAVLLPARWRPLGIVAVLLWAFAVGGVRIAMGGHFTSDVLMSAVITALTVWVLHALIVRPGERTA